MIAVDAAVDLSDLDLKCSGCDPSGAPNLLLSVCCISTEDTSGQGSSSRDKGVPYFISTAGNSNRLLTFFTSLAQRDYTSPSCPECSRRLQLVYTSCAVYSITLLSSA